MSGLTTHILDLTHGKPAENVKIELFFLNEDSNTRQLIKKAVTNSDGRLDTPLLTGDEAKIGNYELIFHIGEYFSIQNIELPDPPFLEKVPVQFGIANLEAHYHVPLLVSPWGYQVYRGS